MDETSIVRLELTVPSKIAAEVANKLLAIYCWPNMTWPEGCTGASVEVLQLLRFPAVVADLFR